MRTQSNGVISNQLADMKPNGDISNQLANMKLSIAKVSSTLLMNDYFKKIEDGIEEAVLEFTNTEGNQKTLKMTRHKAGYKYLECKVENEVYAVGYNTKTDIWYLLHPSHSFPLVLNNRDHQTKIEKVLNVVSQVSQTATDFLIEQKNRKSPPTSSERFVGPIGVGPYLQNKFQKGVVPENNGLSLSKPPVVNQPVTVVDQQDKEKKIILCSSRLDTLKSDIISRIKNKQFPVSGGLFAGKSYTYMNNQGIPHKTRIPENVFQILGIIDKKDKQNEKWDADFALGMVVEQAIVASKNKSWNREPRVQDFYSNILDTLQIDAQASLNKINNFIDSIDQKQTKDKKSGWGTRYHHRPTTVNKIKKIIDSGKGSDIDKLKEIIYIAAKAAEDNTQLFNFRSKITETFYAQITQFLVLQDNNKLAPKV